MVFTRGDAGGAFADTGGNGIGGEGPQAFVEPPERLSLAERGAHVCKAESVSDGNGKHYFYLVSPIPSYPCWIKIREA